MDGWTARQPDCIRRNLDVMLLSFHALFKITPPQRVGDATYLVPDLLWAFIFLKSLGTPQGLPIEKRWKPDYSSLREVPLAVIQGPPLLSQENHGG